MNGTIKDDIEVLKKFDAEVKGIIDFIKLQDLELHDDYYGSVTSGKDTELVAITTIKISLTCLDRLDSVSFLVHVVKNEILTWRDPELPMNKDIVTRAFNKQVELIKVHGSETERER
ncbi:14462_t:CDS:2 [Entrophospora sp. SA101]|nr:12740_t:CDS:2 [Entrophospora sp. SA101]CAJ0631264.1 14456_t:CDS:2 [Entrophospora sp. SA101]CAJ0631273.1 14462_t:CDS:2 [Entrophospora sp. SA101]CAJ0833035.1 13100_t:CDS:2 [Entrophospora sp. SA101]CAJ0854516.1 3815_t:CDS:2 [Entrophospora sp. SA101]